MGEVSISRDYAALRRISDIGLKRYHGPGFLVIKTRRAALARLTTIYSFGVCLPYDRTGVHLKFGAVFLGAPTVPQQKHKIRPVLTGLKADPGNSRGPASLLKAIPSEKQPRGLREGTAASGRSTRPPSSVYSMLAGRSRR